MSEATKALVKLERARTKVNNLLGLCYDNADVIYQSGMAWYMNGVSSVKYDLYEGEMLNEVKINERLEDAHGLSIFEVDFIGRDTYMIFDSDMEYIVKSSLVRKNA